MHIFFSGIGGAGIGPLAMIAKQAGYQVSGSDINDSSYIDYLKKHGIDQITIGQTREQIESVHAANPIDWFVYSVALPMTNRYHPELVFCKENGVKATSRTDFLKHLIDSTGLKLLAIAGTHGKSTTTAMAVWVFKQLGLPVSYSLGAKISFGEMGEYDPKSHYFVYEADEYHRNFLSFYPELSIITGIDWDHPDIYPSRETYLAAFNEFLDQSEYAQLWHDDAEQLNLEAGAKYQILDHHNLQIDSITLPGAVNRQNAWQVAQALAKQLNQPLGKLIPILNKFPGASRRFELIAPNIYSDYAHTPPKIRGALQTAHEMAGDNVVVIYEGLHNTRQHFIKNELTKLFDNLKQLYIVPSYLAREDKNLKLLSPADIKESLSPEAKRITHTAALNENLSTAIKRQAASGNLVLVLSAGGGGSLDEWLRKQVSF